jgi:hypothetical protein
MNWFGGGGLKCMSYLQAHTRPIACKATVLSEHPYHLGPEDLLREGRIITKQKEFAWIIKGCYARARVSRTI